MLGLTSLLLGIVLIFVLKGDKELELESKWKDDSDISPPLADTDLSELESEIDVGEKSTENSVELTE